MYKFRELWSSNLLDLMMRLQGVGGCTYAKYYVRWFLQVIR